MRAERLLIYLADPAKAVAEMKRVAKPGGRIALIEPDFGTTTINLPNRPMVRRALAHEADTAVVQSWLPGPLLGMLRDLGLGDIEVATRVVIFPQGLAAEYFADVGRHAAAAGAITADELTEWLSGIGGLAAHQALFGTVGYFLFTARDLTRPPSPRPRALLERLRRVGLDRLAAPRQARIGHEILVDVERRLALLAARSAPTSRPSSTAQLCWLSARLATMIWSRICSWTVGLVIGTIASTRRSRLRGIMSAEPI